MLDLSDQLGLIRFDSISEPGEGSIKNLGLSHIGNAERNKRIILNTLRDRAPLTRIELSRTCKLSIATTKRLIDELISENLVREGEAGARSGRGRKAALLHLNE